MRSAGQQNLSGFTLIEVLVAVGIFSVIAVTLYTTYSNAMQIDRRSRAVGLAYRQARWAIAVLSADLENVVDEHLPMSEDGAVHRVTVGDATDHNVTVVTGEMTEERADTFSFSGDAQALSFIRAVPGGLVVVRYALRPVADLDTDSAGTDWAGFVPAWMVEAGEAGLGQVLIREQAELRSLDLDSDSAWRQTVLLRNLDGEQPVFAYVPGPQVGDSEEIPWQEDWSEQSLPSGVRFNIAYAQGAGDQGGALHQDILIPLGAWGAP